MKYVNSNSGILSNLEDELKRLVLEYKKNYQLSYVVYEEEYFAGTEEEYSTSRTKYKPEPKEIKINESIENRLLGSKCCQSVLDIVMQS